jgi:hypothetical protein
MYIICQNNQYLSYFCVILFICKMRAEGIKNSAHLDKCVTAKTVHYFKNREQISSPITQCDINLQKTNNFC